MPSITHPNGQVTYYEDDNFTDPWKASETIMIQPGFARHSAFWYHWIPALSRQYRVIRRDARGHGKSSSPSKPYTLDDVLLEIIDTLDQLGLQKVHFMGESTGGIFAETLAARHPDRLLSVITCSTPMYLPASAQEGLAFGHSSWAAACRELGSRGYAHESLKVLGTDQIPDKAYLEWWIDQVSVSSGEGLGGHAEVLSKLDARSFIDDIRIPMLILAPTNSGLAKLDGDASQRELHSRVHMSKLVIVDGAGHEIYIDQAEGCQEALLSFLSSLA